MPPMRRMISISTTVAFLFSLLSQTAIAQHHGQRCPPLPKRQTGKAMFYGKTFHGRTMANGQLFDMNALTAASRTLPLGVRARVINQRTKRAVVITITDRGTLHAPHVIIDLSAGAARQIGLTEQEGVAPVVVQPLGFAKDVCS